jgi:alginate O-acetyltransferase complex protein AlgJ
MKQGLAARIQAGLFLIVISCGFVLVLLHLISQGRERYGAMGFAQVTDGRLTKQVDDTVIKAIPKSEALNGLQAGIEYRLFDDAGPQVRAGCPGWLFLGEEVWEVKDGEQNIASHLAVARKLSDYFRRMRVVLILLTVPDKARVAAADLCSQRVSPQSKKRLGLWHTLARSLPVPQVDITKDWPGKPGYWRTDTHWDRLGARFAANRTARMLISILGTKGEERATVERSRIAAIRLGDLMRLSNIQHAPRWLQPPPDFERAESVTWTRSGGLLGAAPPSDVILAGSSYSRNSGFIDDLGIDLGREVVQESEDGSGFDGSIFDLFKKHRNTLAQARAVIWEFPERTLTQPLNDEERAFLRR